MTTGAWICLAAPLAGVVLIILGGTRIARRTAGWVATLSVASRMYSPICRSDRFDSGTSGAASWKSWICPGQIRTSVGTPTAASRRAA